MTEFDSKTRKWGNSLGLVIPKEEVEKAKIKEGETLHCTIIRENKELGKIWGIGKNTKKTTQQMKDDMRKELYD